MKNSQFKIQIWRLVFCVLCFAFCISAVQAQSTNQDAPTNVSGTEISGTINARDIGDARLTTYYYRFDGSQGDVFINVKADNFSGDIDIYYLEGLRPLSKITFYADDSLTETGRVIYLRKAEQLLLRVQGRTLDDKPALFQIKFAGSFVALQNNSAETGNDAPTVKKEESSGIRVNSVGTIIEKPAPPVKTTSETASKTAEPVQTDEQKQVEKSEEKTTAEKIESENAAKADEPEKKIGELNPETKAESKSEIETKPETTPEAKPDESVVAAENKKPAKITVSKKPKRDTAKTEKAEKAVESPKEKNDVPVDPLENVRLIVLLKNGEKAEYPMPQVFRFALSNGVLTVTTKDGKIVRYPIIEVLKMSVE